MSAFTRELRGHGITADSFHAARLIAREHGYRYHFAASVGLLGRGETPEFTSRGTRLLWSALSAVPGFYASAAARCRECDERAWHCRCAAVGYSPDAVLYPHECSVCGEATSDGRDCCDPEPEADEDGYYRGDWSGISRRPVRFVGTRTDFAPYFCGIEFETDSTPTDSDWSEISARRDIMGAWPDSTVRGPEIVTQPVKGQYLVDVVRFLSELDVSVTSRESPKRQQCGLHIHVDCREACDRTKLAFLELFLHIRDVLWAMPESHLRHHSDYCHPLDAGGAEYWRDRLAERPSDEDEPARYVDINLHALREHSTIEVRLFGWPASANAWSSDTRFRFMWQCVRTVQALRLCARYMSDFDGPIRHHPIFFASSTDALALILSAVPEVL